MQSTNQDDPSIPSSGCSFFFVVTGADGTEIFTLLAGKWKHLEGIGCLAASCSCSQSLPYVTDPEGPVDKMPTKTPLFLYVSKGDQLVRGAPDRLENSTQLF